MALGNTRSIRSGSSLIHHPLRNAILLAEEDMIFIVLSIIYAILGLMFIFALASRASLPTPKQNREVELLQLMLRTELRSKPLVWRMDETTLDFSQAIFACP